jgi:hypothetical protein
MNEKFRVSLSVAEELKAAGYPQEGCDGYWENQVSKDAFPSYRLVDFKAEYAAPCVGALGEVSPEWVC